MDGPDMSSISQGCTGATPLFGNDERFFVPKGLQDSAWGFYEAELVKAVLQKSIFLEYCLVWTAMRRQGTYAGSLVLDRHGARQEHRDDQVPKVSEAFSAALLGC
jgi:hypothetical protein